MSANPFPAGPTEARVMVSLPRAVAERSLRYATRQVRALRAIPEADALAGDAARIAQWTDMVDRLTAALASVPIAPEVAAGGAPTREQVEALATITLPTGYANRNQKCIRLNDLLALFDGAPVDARTPVAPRLEAMGMPLTARVAREHNITEPALPSERPEEENR